MNANTTRRIVPTYQKHAIGEFLTVFVGGAWIQAEIVEDLGQDGSGMPGIGLLTKYVVKVPR